MHISLDNAYLYQYTIVMIVMLEEGKTLMYRNKDGKPMRDRYGYGAKKNAALKEEAVLPAPRPDTKQFPKPKRPYLEDMPCVGEMPVEDRPTTVLRKNATAAPVSAPPQRQVRQVVKSVAPVVSEKPPTNHRPRKAQVTPRRDIQIERRNTPPPAQKRMTTVARERFLERQHVVGQQVNDWNKLPMIDEVKHIVQRVEAGGLPYLYQAYLHQNPFVLSIHAPNADSVIITAGDSTDELYKEEFGIERFVEVQATVDDVRRMLVMGDNGYPIELQSEKDGEIHVIPVVSRDAGKFKIESVNKPELAAWAASVVQELRTTYKDSILECKNLGGRSVREICTTLNPDTANAILVPRPARRSGSAISDVKAGKHSKSRQ